MCVSERERERERECECVCVCVCVCARARLKCLYLTRNLRQQINAAEGRKSNFIKRRSHIYC